MHVPQDKFSCSRCTHLKTVLSHKEHAHKVGIEGRAKDAVGRTNGELGGANVVEVDACAARHSEVLKGEHKLLGLRYKWDDQLHFGGVAAFGIEGPLQESTICRTNGAGKRHKRRRRRKKRRVGDGYVAAREIWSSTCCAEGYAGRRMQIVFTTTQQRHLNSELLQ